MNIKLTNTSTGLAYGELFAGSQTDEMQKLVGSCNEYFIVTPVHCGHAREEVVIPLEGSKVCLYAAMKHNIPVMIKDGYTGLVYKGTVETIKNRQYNGGDAFVTRTISIKSVDGHNYIGVSIWEHNCEVALDISSITKDLPYGVEILEDEDE